MPKGDKIAAYLAKPVGSGPFRLFWSATRTAGLVEHIKDVARRFGQAGYAALAVYLRRAKAVPRRSATLPRRVRERHTLRSATSRIPSRHGLHAKPIVRAQGACRHDRLCFGGAVAWRRRDPGAESEGGRTFYGPNPTAGGRAKIKAAILALYEERTPASMPEFRRSKKHSRQNNKVFQKIVYDGAGHAFQQPIPAPATTNAAKDAVGANARVV